MNRYLCMLIGGEFGSLTRYLAGGTFVQPFSRRPYNRQLVEVVGFLGGYTTLSILNTTGTLPLAADISWTALAYLVGSVVLGCASIWLGAFLVTKQ